MNRKRVGFLILFTAITLLTLFLLYPSKDSFRVGEDLVNLLGYMALLAITVKYELYIEKIPVSLAPILLIPVFLQNGPFWAALFYGFGGLLIHLILRKPLVRSLYLANMYVWSTLVASAVYISLGGRFNPWPLTLKDGFYTLLFIIALFFTQILLLHFYYRYLRRTSLHYARSFRWILLAHLLSVPFGGLNDLIHRELGILGLLFLAIPVTASVLLFRLYYEKSAMVERLKQLHNVTIALNSGLELKRSLHSLEQGFRLILPNDLLLIFIRDHENEFTLFFSSAEEAAVDEEGIYDGYQPPYDRTGIGSVRLEPSFLSRAARWDSPVLLKPGELSDFPFSLQGIGKLLFSPFRFDGRLTGFMVIGSRKEQAFHSIDRTLLQILSNQISITLGNVQKYGYTERRSMMDELTGLHNFRYFQQAAARLFEEAKRENRPLSLMMIDIDHFKLVNDTFGHLAGNRVLQVLAERIRETVRKQDIVARYGGEEFTILLPGVSAAEALEVAERIRTHVERTKLPIEGFQEGGEVLLRVTVSIGISSFPDHAEDANALIRQADRAMYVGAKREGRNRVALYGA